MNYKNVFSALLFAGLLLLSACSKKAPSIEEAAKRMVAFNEPAVIMSLEIKELFDKGGITSKENIPMIAQMFFPDKIEYMTDPEKFGLDLTGTSYLAATAGDKANVVWALTKIKDKEKFEKMLKEEGYDKFEEIEGYNTTMEKQSMIFAWNESLLITLISKEEKTKETFTKYAAAIADEEKKPSDAFVKFFDKKADGVILTNLGKSGELQKNMPSDMKGNEKEMETLNRMTDKMKGSYSMFSISFEKDKVVSDINNMFTDAFKKEIDFFAKEGLPKELLAQIGSNDLKGFIAINGDVKGYIDWLVQMMGDKDIFAEAREETGLDVLRMMKSLKGNLILSVFDFPKTEGADPKSKEGESKSSIKGPVFSIVTTTNDNYIETIADSVLKSNKKGNYFVVQDRDPKYVMFKPGIIFYTNNEELVKNPLASADPQLEAEAAKVLAQPLSFFFNLNQLVGSIDKSEMTQKVAGKLKYVYGGMNIDGGHAELILNTGGKNSLWTLINITVEATADMAMSFK